MKPFSEYLASAITPQMTLLEKFNALLEYLKLTSKTQLIYHEITFTNSSTNTSQRLSFIDTKDKEYTFDEINSADFINSIKFKINMKLWSNSVIVVNRSGGRNLFSHLDSSNHFNTFELTSVWTITEQKVEIYEG